ncbi:hypothetical protein GCM10009839_39890 [Catenulispora yoronensis]|uniref:Uncharacterized protein n=2 Tax=Catenulispora yoronensis TaxID=450799 RepID=A0ABN2UDG3_9ACTN
MEDNAWTDLADATRVTCPPRGRELEVVYPDGDFIKLEFREVPSREEAANLFGEIPSRAQFPSTILMVGLRLQEFGLDLQHGKTNRAGFLNIGGYMYSGHCQNGLPLPMPIIR